jgi:hypothetical protein
LYKGQTATPLVEYIQITPAIQYLSNHKIIYMNIFNFFDHPEKKDNKDYFVQLVRSAKADDIIRNSELELLHSIGKKLGFTEPEIINLIAMTDKTDYIPPYELSKRFDQVYEIVRMIMADGVAENNEMKLAEGFAIRSGFSEEEIPNLLALLLRGIEEGKDEEELFEVYKKIRKT